jgi:hypothetical protein
LTFARFVDLIGEALLEPEGSGRQSFTRAKEHGVFPVSAVDFPFASVFELSSEGESCVMLAVGGASRLRRASAIHRAVAKHSL